jgi:hemin uptake protein HemP
MSPAKPPFDHGFEPAPVRQEEPAARVRHDVSDLMKGGREAILIHRGQEYRLRITAAGKLILTK